MLERLERFLVACNRWLLILLLLAMACIVFANVVLRYTTGDSIVWAEEVARHMMIWVTFLGAGVSEFLCKRDGLQLTQIRSPNSMVNRFSAAFQSRIGMLHFWLMLRKAR